MAIIPFIKSNPRLKKFVLWTLMPVNDNKPRLWVRYLLNPFKHTRGSGARMRTRARREVFPFHEFRLGAASIIEDFATVNNGVGDVRIGERSMIGIGSVVIGPVTIGSDVMLAQHVVVSGLNHGYQDVTVPPNKQPVETRQIAIGDGAWIGANSVITAGVAIGRHSIIGAGSVVTRNIPDFSVAVGNPAKVVKQYNEQKKCWERI